MTSVAIIPDMALTLCSQGLLFAGRPVRINTNSPKIARYFADFLAGDNPIHFGEPESAATITVHVRERDGLCESSPWFRARGHFAFARFTLADAFWFNLRTREVYGVCTPEAADDVWRWRAHILPALLGILSAVIGVAPVHGACVARGGRGTLLTGPSGTGKSTLTIALAKRGYKLLSDEWTYISAAGPDVAAWGLSVPVKLLPDASRFFPELLNYCPATALNGEAAYEVFPEECFGVSRQTHSSVNGIVLLERTALPGCRVDQISAAEATHRLSQELEPLEGPLEYCYQHQLALIQRLAGAACLRLSFNENPCKVAEALDAVLARME